MDFTGCRVGGRRATFEMIKYLYRVFTIAWGLTYKIYNLSRQEAK